MSNLIAWIIRAIPFGTIIMFGSMGEITTEKSGNLNLGVPGIMYLGGFAGFASSYFYEKNSADPKGWICVILALVAAIAAARTNPQAQILIYEKKDSAGKKILATGNGRCNLTNKDMKPVLHLPHSVWVLLISLVYLF